MPRLTLNLALEVEYSEADYPNRHAVEALVVDALDEMAREGSVLAYPEGTDEPITLYSVGIYEGDEE